MKLTRSEAMKLRHAVRRIDTILEATEYADLLAGKAWYLDAHAVAASIAAETGLTVRQCAGIIAALSPRCQWGANKSAAIKVARAAVAGEPLPSGIAGLPSNHVKAWRIAHGEDPLDVLGGPKVRAFFANIMGDEETVTVDAWAARAAEGRWIEQAPARRRYDLLAESYRRAARKRGLTPRECQAAVWTAFRRAHARALTD